MRTVKLIVVLALLLAFSGAAMAQSADADAAAAALIEKPGIKGGLCLLVGAKDTSLATALVGKSTLYVQVLQPDDKLPRHGARASRNPRIGRTSAYGARRSRPIITARICST